MTKKQSLAGVVTGPGKEVVKLGVECLDTFMSVMVQLDEKDWQALSLDMGENEQICWQQIELLTEYFKEVTK